MKNLLVVVNGDDYFDDTTVNDEHLPCDVIDIVDKYDDLTYLILTENTKGELTITNVDRNCKLIVCNNVFNYYSDTLDEINGDGYYKNNNNMSLIVNELCKCKTRLLFDDGG